MLDPVVDEIFRIFEVLQNDDGSWGSEENELDRMYVTSWVMKSIWDRKDIAYKHKTLNFFNDVFRSYKYNIDKTFNEIRSEKFIKGILNVAEILFDSNMNNGLEIETFYFTLLKNIKSHKWLSSLSVASYVIIGLQKYDVFSGYINEAKKYINQELYFQRNELNLITPDICIAIPDILVNFLHNKDEFLKEAESLTDIKLAHCLIALVRLNNNIKNNQLIINKIRSELLERLRKRQFTEVDKKLTKSLLNLTLLLKSGHRGTTLIQKIRNYEPILNVELDSSNVLLKINIEKLQDNLGYINLHTLSSYVYTIQLLNEKYVYLLNTRDYEIIKPFFLTNTIPVSIKREQIFEIIILGITSLIYILASYNLGLFIEITAGSLKWTSVKEYGMEAAFTIILGLFSLIFWQFGLINHFPILKKYLKRDTSKEEAN